MFMLCLEGQTMPKKKPLIPKYEGEGPALLAAAITSKPHLRQRGNEISLTEIDGKELVRVPLMRKSIVSHPWVGKLVFDDEFFELMIKNHKSRVTDFSVSLDFRHTDDFGILARLDPDDGGYLAMEDSWLIAYGAPADEKAKEIILGRKWPYSSPEFHPDYKSHLLKKLTNNPSPDKNSITLESCTEIKEEVLMTKKFKFGDITFELEGEEGNYTLPEDAVSILEKVSEITNKVTPLETQVVTLKDETKTLKSEKQELKGKIALLEKDDSEPEMSDAVRLMFEEQQGRITELEAQEVELKQSRLKEQVAVTLRAAEEKVVDGYGYTKPLLDLIKAGMLLESTEEVKLENQADPEQVASYYRNLLVRVLKVGLERVPVESKTEHDDLPMSASVGANGNQYSTEELKTALEGFERY